jgi:hypothetical protein
MSAVTRRGVLRGGALASAALAVPVGAAALRQAGLVVYDSAIAESRAFARSAGAVRKLDLAAEHRARFATLRAGLPKGRSIEGLTRWSDWVALRSELETQGWRLAFEARSGRRGELFRWTMKRG